ncbi:hypothetical protein Gogos_016220 [Gossypium gossypioides]|uniref:CRAL/TRIO N-terminal domain-containing protein n=1 Tax=Gossypium gossypioides TaxID=34282 RepID=A0A7J9B6Y4_GOSGO|nr:hypothetical protein [Gossypium gossypioides]
MMMSSNNMECSAKAKEEEEITKISLMRSLVETQDPSSKEVDDMTMRRFLRARELDVEKASSMFLKYLKWRRSFVPNGFISPSELTHEIQQNKMFLQGSDKKGRPISVLLAARHFQHNGGLDEFKRTPSSLFSLSGCDNLDINLLFVNLQVL